MSTITTELKTVGKSGQISLGKGFAGKTLRLLRQADGSILLTPVAVIPESQLWTLSEPHRSAIEKGLAWAAENPPAETDRKVRAIGYRDGDFLRLISLHPDHDLAYS